MDHWTHFFGILVVIALYEAMQPVVRRAMKPRR